jgi:hypothetical protein
MDITGKLHAPLQQAVPNLVYSDLVRGTERNGIYNGFL